MTRFERYDILVESVIADAGDIMHIRILGRSCAARLASTAVAALVVCALSASVSEAATTAYKYDALGRVVQATFGNGSRERYAYDPAGNRTAINRTVPGPAAYNDAATTAYTTAVTLDPRLNDIDGDDYALTVSAVGTAGHGTTSQNGTSVTYTPASGFSGTDSFTYTISDGHGATSTATVTVTVGAPAITSYNVTAASNLRTIANSNGYAGASGVTIQFVVPAGTTVMGAAGGGRGVDTGTWPAGVSLSLVVNGNLYGGGGTGGSGSALDDGNPGTAGGDAVYVQAPISITVTGTIKAGGGGGGGGAGGAATGKTVGGGGGGGGFPNGVGGAGATGTKSNGGPGGTGTTTAGGAGGSPGGAAGGGPATGGSKGANATYGTGGTGGAAGYGIRFNGNAVTVTGSANVSGTQG